jgi:Ca-activated chloride channel family protein
MFDFAHPELLFAGLAVPLLLWLWLRQRRPALRFSGTGFLTGLPGGRRRLAVWGGATLRAVGLLLLVVALAGPRWADAHTRLSTEGIAIEILVDVSGSMAEPDFEWPGPLSTENKANDPQGLAQKITRLEAVKRVFRLFVKGGEAPTGVLLEGRPNDLIGLVTFATRPRSACPLTLSHDVLLDLLGKEEARSLPEESRTNIGDAIALAVDDLEKGGPRTKVLILFTDGEHNVEPPCLKPREAAQLAARKYVRIYAIDAGSETAGPEVDREGQTRSAEDRAMAVKTLQAISEKMTHGKYFRAQDVASLLDVCREIDRLERQQIESFQYRYYYEGFAWFGLAALGMFVLVHFLEWTVWQRVL